MGLICRFCKLKNKNDCVSVANTPRRMSMSATFAINTSSNKAMIEKKVENDMVVTKVSPSVPLERIQKLILI